MKDNKKLDSLIKKLAIRSKKLHTLCPTRVDKEPDGKQELDYGSEELDKNPESLTINDVKKEDKLKGGMADGKPDSKYDPKELAMGIKIEMEHTKDKAKAKEIAKDHLEEIPDYYSRLKVMEDKADKDGVKKSVFNAWEELKKKLNNAESILDLEEAQAPEEQEQPQEEPAPPEGNSQGQELPQEQAQQEGQDNGDMSEEDAQKIMGQLKQGGQEQEQPQGQEQEQPEVGDDKEKVLIEALQQEGYSESEIAHIVHGHSAPQVDPVDQSKVAMNEAKTEADKAAAGRDNAIKENEAKIESEIRIKEAETEAEHQKHMYDLELNSAKEKANTVGIDNEHKKRMLDLDFDHEKKVKELEIEYKKKELELKLENRKQAAKDSDARTTKSPKKLNKSEEGSGEKLNKSDWLYNKTTQQFSHPQHGSVMIDRDDKGYNLKHQGRIVSNHPNKSNLMVNAANYMRQLGNRQPNMEGIGTKPKYIAKEEEIHLDDKIPEKDKKKYKDEDDGV